MAWVCVGHLGAVENGVAKDAAHRVAVAASGVAELVNTMICGTFQPGILSVAGAGPLLQWSWALPHTLSTGASRWNHVVSFPGVLRIPFQMR